MFIILILNTIILILSYVDDDPEKMEVYDEIDDFCLYFYIAEFCLKIIGLGIIKYFDDNWNIFDFAMIIFSLFASFL